MHSFLKSVGFSKLSTAKQEKLLIDSILEKPQKKKMITNPVDSETMYAELSNEYAPGVGVRIVGQIDEYEQFRLEFYYPYFRGRFKSVEQDCYIGRKLDNVSYSGICEDERISVSLIFHVIDTIDCIKNDEPNTSNKKRNIYLSGLASEGVILLPTIYTEEAREESTAYSKRAKTIAEAREGSAEALEKLALDDIDTFTGIGSRLKDEDVLSIVETSFIPFGMETELYKVLGIIESVDTVINPVLGEKLYILKLLCNDVVFDICINSLNLSGEPLPGRRFRGILWLQGRVE